MEAANDHWQRRLEDTTSEQRTLNIKVELLKQEVQELRGAMDRHIAKDEQNSTRTNDMLLAIIRTQENQKGFFGGVSLAGAFVGAVLMFVANKLFGPLP